MPEYSEKVKILKKINKGYEANILVAVLDRNFDKTLECFIYGRSKENFVEGQKIKIQFYLLDFPKKEKLNSSIKKISQFKRTANSVNRAVVFGQIISMKGHEKFADYQDVILDCDVYIKTRVKNDDGFQVGDYVKIEGRLDAIYISE